MNPTEAGLRKTPSTPTSAIATVASPIAALRALTAAWFERSTLKAALLEAERRKDVLTVRHLLTHTSGLEDVIGAIRVVHGGGIWARRRWLNRYGTPFLSWRFET